MPEVRNILFHDIQEAAAILDWINSASTSEIEEMVNLLEAGDYDSRLNVVYMPC